MGFIIYTLKCSKSHVRKNGILICFATKTIILKNKAKSDKKLNIFSIFVYCYRCSDLILSKENIKINHILFFPEIYNTDTYKIVSAKYLL